MRSEKHDEANSLIFISSFRLFKKNQFMISFSFAEIFCADKGKPIPVQAWTGPECSRQMILCGWIIHIPHVRRWESARR